MNVKEFCLFICILLLLNCSSTKPLIKASQHGEKTQIDQLLSEGANINEQDNVLMTSLMHAIWNQQYESAKYLIYKGADVNIKSGSGETALHKAAIKGDEEIIRLLVARGAKVNERSKIGATPLLAATDWKNIKTAKVLLELKADPNILTDDSRSALMFSILRGNVDLSRELVKHGADINKKDNLGYTALHIATGVTNDFEASKFLIESGADVNAIDEINRQSPLFYAVNKRNLAIAGLLLTKVNNINLRNKKGDTCLILAAYAGEAAMVRMLLEHGADKNIKSNDGENAESLARKGHHNEVVKLLRNSH